MITCPVCGEQINYATLRSESPKCSQGHELGHWLSCQNANEMHVYLASARSQRCIYCSSAAGTIVKEGSKVKCLHATAEGLQCQTRPFLWIKEGPPCFMNHVSKMRLV